MTPKMQALSQEQVDALPSGAIVTVLWDGSRSALWTYRVENVHGVVYCVEVLVDDTFRKTQRPLHLKEVVTERIMPKHGTVVLYTPPRKRRTTTTA